MENQNPIDDLFQTVGEPFEMEPTAKVWDSLDAQLEKRKSDALAKKFLFYKRLSILLLLLVGSLFTYILIDSHKNTTGSNKENNIAVANSPSGENKNTVIPLAENSNSTPPSSTNNLNSNSNTNSNSVEMKSTETKTPEQNQVAGNHSDNSTPSKKTTAGNENKGSAKTNSVNTNGSHPSSNKTNSFLPNNSNETISNSNPVATTPTPTATIATPANAQPALALANKKDFLHPIFLPVRWNGSYSAYIDSLKISDQNYFPIDDSHSRRPSPLAGFYAAGFYSPDYINRRTKSDRSGDDDEHHESDYSSKEESEYSYTSGLMLGYQFNPHWSIQSEMDYSVYNQSVDAATVYAKEGQSGQLQYSFYTSAGTVVLPNNSALGHPSSSDDSVNLETYSRQSIRYVSVPLLVKYQLNFSKFALYGFGGVSANFLSGQQMCISTHNSEYETIKTIQGLKGMNYGFRFGLGVQYPFFKGASVFAEPVFRGSLTSINKGTPIKSYPYSLGLNVGLSYHF